MITLEFSSLITHPHAIPPLRHQQLDKLVSGLPFDSCVTSANRIIGNSVPSRRACVETLQLQNPGPPYHTVQYKSIDSAAGAAINSVTTTFSWPCALRLCTGARQCHLHPRLSRRRSQSWATRCHRWWQGSAAPRNRPSVGGRYPLHRRQLGLGWVSLWESATPQRCCPSVKCNICSFRYCACRHSSTAVTLQSTYRCPSASLRTQARR